MGRLELNFDTMLHSEKNAMQVHPWDVPLLTVVSMETRVEEDGLPPPVLDFSHGLVEKLPSYLPAGLQHRLFQSHQENSYPVSQPS